MNTNSKPQNIGVFFGSRSPEHDVSIITGQMIIAGLRKLGHSVTPIYISKKGAWLIGEELGSLKEFTDPSKKINADIGPGKKFAEYYLDLEASHGQMVFKKKGLGGKTIAIDIAFPAMHGSYGEDGTIQGLFEMLDIPYVGCDVTSAAIAMDKAHTKTMFRQSSIPTTHFVVFYKNEWEADKKAVISRIRRELKGALFVKPVHLGSSIGISKVKENDDKDLEYRIEVALHFDKKVLVEEGVPNLMDVTCCIIGNDTLTASELQESVFSSDLFDFEEKYLKEGGAQLGASQSGIVIPARLDAQMTNAIKDAARLSYRAIGCCGIARVDFLVDTKAGIFYANEVNPLPGTLYHHLWKASGVELGDLLGRLIAFAREKHDEKKDMRITFDSEILKQLDSVKLKSSKLKH